MGAGAVGILPEFRRFVRMEKKKINATPDLKNDLKNDLKMTLKNDLTNDH